MLKLSKLKSKTKLDFKSNIEKVLKNNLKSGSYVLEQDGSVGTESILSGSALTQQA